jgi:CheY-like chemotaxis protein
MTNILWIDDDEELLNQSEPMFARHGFRILKGTNTSRALTTLREERVDGVLLDVRLANGESGLELLQELRTRDLKVAVFTAYPDYEDHLTAEESGAIAYFEKIDKSIPLEPEQQRAFFAALHKIFPLGGTMPQQKNSPQRDLWRGGLFFLLVFLVIIAGIAALERMVSPWLFPVALIACALLYTIIGAFILRQQGTSTLSEQSFLKLTLESLRLLPLLHKQQKK